MGKRVGKDADRGKLTFPGLLGVEESHRRAEQLIDEACEALAPLGDRGRRLGSRWPDTSWKGIVDGRAPFDDPLARDLKRLSHEAARPVGRRDARGALPAGGHANRPFRLEPGRGRADPGAAHHLRLSAATA